MIRHHNGLMGQTGNAERVNSTKGSRAKRFTGSEAIYNEQNNPDNRVAVDLAIIALGIQEDNPDLGFNEALDIAEAQISDAEHLD